MQINHHIGRSTKPVQFKLAGSKQTPVAYLNLAVKGFSKETVDFISYVAFNKTAELLKRLVTEKGMVVEVEFNMQSSTYSDAATGEKKYRQQNVISNFQIYRTKKVENNTSVSNDSVIEGNMSVGNEVDGIDPFAGMEIVGG
ncbi:single-stranded DNA-binding protein [Leuconostoc pseudomesenteroides]|uniref:single-stranded DNA-binding protein n=1 Tax=Leuconostoc pseudomesenteroides TaxID=33968 RepID=UPI0039EB5540